MTWIYDESIDPTEFYGMVYRITHIATGRAYLGKKKFWIEKGGKIHKESDWRTYWSSCTDLLAEVAIQGDAAFRREILHFCLTGGEMKYWEEHEQHINNVLTANLPDGSPAYWNGNISMIHTQGGVRGYQDPIKIAKRKKTLANQKKKAGLLGDQP